MNGDEPVKLDLLYEFQPKVKPWTLPHPYGQRDAEQGTYDEAIEEIQLRTGSASTPCGWSSTTSVTAGRRRRAARRSWAVWP